MIHFPCRRLLARLLLFGQVLSSCHKPLYLGVGHSEPYIAPASVVRQPMVALAAAPQKTFPTKEGYMLQLTSADFKALVTDSRFPGLQPPCYCHFSFRQAIP